ncbi:MAG: DUF5714 domain-containing protein [Actinomycetota bacterium]|nr:DUF5714 domain-containing protein [Actinomycetota bacterium]
MTCCFCGKESISNIWCPEGHFFCISCHSLSIIDFVAEIIKTSPSKNPFALAAIMMAYPKLPGCSCEHAWIFTASVLTAVKNEGAVKLTIDDIFKALRNVKKQIALDSEFKNNVCSIVPAVGIVFNTIFTAVGNGQDDTTMRVVAQATEYLADNQLKCRCCKNQVWTTIGLLVSLLNARFGIQLDGSVEDVTCHLFKLVENCSPATCPFSTLYYD